MGMVVDIVDVGSAGPFTIGGASTKQVVACVALALIAGAGLATILDRRRSEIELALIRELARKQEAAGS